MLGFGSVAIGFAFRDIFENFLAGVLLMLRRKMRIGDLIECEGVEGRVEQTTLRETYLRRLDNELTIVPNSFLFKNPLRVLTDATLRRYEIVVGVAYDTDLDRAAKLIADAVAPLDGVDGRRPVEVYAREFNDSSIDFTVRWWAGSMQLDMHRSRDRVVRAVKRALEDGGSKSRSRSGCTGSGSHWRSAASSARAAATGRSDEHGPAKTLFASKIGIRLPALRLHASRRPSPSTTCVPLARAYAHSRARERLARALRSELGELRVLPYRLRELRSCNNGLDSSAQTG